MEKSLYKIGDKVEVKTTYFHFVGCVKEVRKRKGDYRYFVEIDGTDLPFYGTFVSENEIINIISKK